MKKLLWGGLGLTGAFVPPVIAIAADGVPAIGYVIAGGGTVSIILALFTLLWNANTRRIERIEEAAEERQRAVLQEAEEARRISSTQTERLHQIEIMIVEIREQSRRTASHLTSEAQTRADVNGQILRHLERLAK